MNVLPELNTMLTVGVGLSRDPASGLRASGIASRVEDVVPPVTGKSGHRGKVLIATPSYEGDVEGIAPATACTLTWTTPNGIMELPTSFEDAVAPQGDSVLRTWLLNVTGPTVRVQRREHFRCPCRLPLTLTVIGRPEQLLDDANLPDDAKAPDDVKPPEGANDPDDSSAQAPLQVTGVSADLSEGGVRCSIAGDQLPDGALVRVSIALETDGVLELEGTVLRVATPASLAAAGAWGGVRPMDTVVAFSEPEVHGDRLRRVIFAEQMRQRRAGLS